MGAATETFYSVIRRQGITRRSFHKFCSLTATSLGLGPLAASRIANALETKPRVPVMYATGSCAMRRSTSAANASGTA